MPTDEARVMDPHLQHVAAAAERGDRCPYLRVFTSGWLVLGLPVSHSRFLELMQTALREAVHAQVEEEAKIANGRRGQADPHEVDTTTGRLMQALGPVAPGDFLNLVNVKTYAGNGMQGAIIATTTLRVPISSVDAWTAVRVDMSMPKASGGGGVGVGVGVLVPFDF